MRRSQVTIDLSALRVNAKVLSEFSRPARMMAVIKADAYGHGAVETAKALPDSDGCAVAFIGEGLELRRRGGVGPIFILQGVESAEELVKAIDANLTIICGSEQQLQMLESSETTAPIWLKVDTGMGRLGVSLSKAKSTLNTSVLNIVGLVSHFASADSPGNEQNKVQLESFISISTDHGLQRSLCNSAGLLAQSDAHFDWTRAGIALYGSNPFYPTCPAPVSLAAVMTFSAPLISIKRLSKGGAVGYGATWVCPEDMYVGVIAAGYADGYPRHARQGTPIYVQGKRCKLIGRVSMDMICVDLRGLEDAKIGAEAELWGKNISVDEVAECAETISYELLCAAGHASFERKYTG